MGTGEKKKKPFVLRIDSEIMKSLEQWAADDFRSLNGQIEYLLHESLSNAGRLSKSSPEKSEGKQK